MKQIWLNSELKPTSKNVALKMYLFFIIPTWLICKVYKNVLYDC